MMSLIDFQIMEGRGKDGARGVAMKGGCFEAVKREASVSCMRDSGPQVSADAHSRGQQ